MLKPIDNLALVRGMSQAVPAHIPEETPHWWSTFNARFRKGRIEQTPTVETFLTLPDPYNVTSLIGYNQKQVAISGKGLYTLDFANLVGTLVAQPVGFSNDLEGRYRWSAVASQSGIYYVSPTNAIIHFDGTICTWNYSGSGPDYKAKYIKNFYGHLVVANIEDGVSSNSFPLRIAYSDIDQFNIFEPLITNEADYYDILENESNSLYGLGITGIQKIGNVLAIFTPGSIWNMRYVGFDNGVMQFHEQIQGIGNWLPYATASLGIYAVFVTNEDFYVYDGNTIQPLGSPIREEFFATLSTDPDTRNRTWCHIETRSQEIRWYYPSTMSGGECDRCVVFNWQTKDWYFEDGQSITAALNAGGNTARNINQLDYLESQINNLDNDSLTIDGLDMVVIWPNSIYATANTGNLCSELGGDVASKVMTLESRDFCIAEAQTIKEIDTLYVDAKVTPVTGETNVGWEVYMASRYYLKDPVVYGLVGLWTSAEAELRLSAPRNAGRFFRFKFISRNVTKSQFYGFSPNFNAGSTEK